MKNGTIGRTVFVATGLITLTLFVGRCSPVSPSMSKHITFGQTGTDKSLTLTEKKPSFNFSSQLVDGDAFMQHFEPGIKSLAINGKVLMLTTTVAGQLIVFKDTGRVEIQIPDPKVKSAVAIFETALTADEINERHGEKFTAVFAPKDKDPSTWVLSVPDSVDKDISDTIRGTLVNVYIVLGATPATFTNAK